MSTKVLAALGLVVAATSASSALAGSASPSARNGKLAYTAVASALQLFAVAPETGAVRRLAPSDAVNFEPAASPDGAHIAFVSSRDGNAEIYVASPDGRNARRLTSHPSYDWDPAWSPDGTKLAFSSGRSGDSEIYVVGADGHGLVRLTHSDSTDENPAWSPDGARIAYWSEPEDDDAEIFVMNADGSGAGPITTNDDEDLFPAWSPDGSLIAFTTDRGSQGDDEIFVMRPDGTGATAVTVTNGSIDDWWPSWSPDGKRIAFTSDRGGEDADIVVINADGKGAVNVTDNEDIHDMHPSWTRSGTIYFTSGRAANLGIEAASPTGADRAVLAKSPAEESSPAYSPDGRRLAYSAAIGESSRIVVMNASGGGARQLARDARFDDTDPAWSPDGTRLVFVRSDAFGVMFLATMKADGTDVRYLLEGGSVGSPDWSPAGRIVLELDGNIVTVNADGRGRRTVTSYSSSSSPSWSPDGRLIAFVSDRDEDEDDDIFVISARGGPATQLTDNDVEDLEPDWSPDGRLIAFARGDLDELESSVFVMRADGKQERRVPLQAPASMPAWQPLP